MNTAILSPYSLFTYSLIAYLFSYLQSKPLQSNSLGSLCL